MMLSRIVIKSFFTVLLTLPFLLNGQVVVDTRCFPQVGDTLVQSIDNLPAYIRFMSEYDENQKWDFRSLQSPYGRKNVILPANFFAAHHFFPLANASVQLSEDQIGFFQISESAIKLVGIQGNDPLGLGIQQPIYYDPPLVERRAPLRYKDGFQNESYIKYSFSYEDMRKDKFSDLPFRPDSLRITITIDRQDYVDAWGELSIPGGSYDVLREKRQFSNYVQLEVKVGNQNWQDVTDLLPNSNLVGRSYEVQYLYHSNEASDPVAVVYLNGAETKVNSVIYKTNQTESNIQDINDMKQGLYAFPNPAIVNVRFEFTNLEPGNYKVSIFNILGLEEWSETYFVNGSRSEKVNISHLRKGTYLYSLVDENGKTISTKRLVVIKP
ncbi:MAG: T9SS type A sorting domain-containing protein [Bacteroidota bacterium]